MAYVTPIAGSGIASQTWGGYETFKINARKKRARSQKSRDAAKTRREPRPKFIAGIGFEPMHGGL